MKCKSDLDKSAKITKLRLQHEYEMNTFCKEDQKDLVCHLQRQLLVRDQRINELSFDLERLKNASTINYKTQPIQILRSNDPDLVISTVSEIFLVRSVLFSSTIAFASCLVLSSLSFHASSPFAAMFCCLFTNLLDCIRLYKYLQFSFLLLYSLAKLHTTVLSAFL